MAFEHSLNRPGGSARQCPSVCSSLSKKMLSYRVQHLSRKPAQERHIRGFPHELSESDGIRMLLRKHLYVPEAPDSQDSSSRQMLCTICVLCVWAPWSLGSADIAQGDRVLCRLARADDLGHGYCYGGQGRGLWGCTTMRNAMYVQGGVAWHAWFTRKLATA